MVCTHNASSPESYLILIIMIPSIAPTDVFDLNVLHKFFFFFFSVQVLYIFT